MNVALPALVVFLILLPGFVARSRFKRAERQSVDYSPFGQVVTEAVLAACLFHGFWLLASYYGLGRYLEVSVLLKFLSSDSASHSKAADAVSANSRLIVAYFGTLLLASYLIPKCLRFVITRYRLDKFDAPFSYLFRFHLAPWYYLLTGADFSEDKQPDFIAVSAIVNVAGEAILYSGVLDDFFVDGEGKLDRLILEQVMRRPIAADKNQTDLTLENDESRFYAVDGDYFVLRYSEAITLNIQYIKLEEFDSSEEPATLSEETAIAA